MAARWGMKYFALTREESHAFPRVINWHHAFDVRKLTPLAYHELPPFIPLNVELGQSGDLPDVIITPFLLLSQEAMAVVSLYDSTIPYVIVALFDVKGEKNRIYYCPVLSDNEEMPLFQIEERGQKKTIIRMDLAESLLERDAVGIGLVHQ